MAENETLASAKPGEKGGKPKGRGGRRIKSGFEKHLFRPTAETVVTASDLAECLGVSVEHVTRLANAGHVKQVAHGLYEFVASVRGYTTYVSGHGEKGTDKARLLRARADKAEIEAAEMAGSVVPIEEVRETWANAVALA